MTETESMVVRVAKAMCASDGANWDAANFNETANGDEPEEQRGYWLEKARAAIAPVIDHAVAIMEARLPLYTDIAARNAIKECISSIKASALVKALEE